MSSTAKPESYEGGREKVEPVSGSTKLSGMAKLNGRILGQACDPSSSHRVDEVCKNWAWSLVFLLEVLSTLPSNCRIST